MFNYVLFFAGVVILTLATNPLFTLGIVLVLLGLQNDSPN